ncbi:uncharacterized protein LAESUDRAFT_660289 [Laetiporus sulphureus 93-53]|uniref:Uncharacterized protein n=1 Tax=Laetiporus sulphureus 93-53 TaxID=1314785 RepID=A0A165CQ89_9APHY|nr:uncharacterized protein LAESUDRAFT_660289 [Laetiporus sulphureus 93-53]KZT03225.1 hypothetical protein LAESUDRAFT_660289 [Laetiporus sulphureus 93-53]
MGELDATYGAVLIGAFVSAVLFGVTNLQAFIYFQRYSSDGVWSKLTVCWLWLLDAVHLAFVVHMVYWYLVTNYFNPLELTVIVWTFKVSVLFFLCERDRLKTDRYKTQAQIIVDVSSLGRLSSAQVTLHLLRRSS